MFEVWVEHAKLIGNLSLTTAIATFLHLCFVFDLKYPQVCYSLPLSDPLVCVCCLACPTAALVKYAL